jgi:Integrase core domain
LGIQAIVCPAHRPDLNADVSRYHRTLKYECLLIHAPESEEQVREVNETFVAHSNQERPNQARSCGNQPPRVAFAHLSSLPRVPDVVDPDRWLRVIDGQHVVRKVRHNGTVLIDDVRYDIKHSLAGQYVDVCVDAHQPRIRDLAPASALQEGSDQGPTEDGSLFRPLCRTHESTSPR